LSETQIIQLVSLVGFLILVLGSLSIRNMQFSFIVKTVIGWAVIAGAIALVVINKDWIGSQFSAAAVQLGITDPEQASDGAEVRIRKSPDGHFWARARINGVERRLLVDSGAAVTLLKTETARATQVAFDGGPPIRIQTPKGIIDATQAQATQIAIGPIVMSRLEVLVAPNEEAFDVLGMNFLSRLKSWRVEGDILILETHSNRDLT